MRRPVFISRTSRHQVGKVGNLTVAGTFLKACFERVGGSSFKINAMLFSFK
jgi:hypothetical protein